MHPSDDEDEFAEYAALLEDSFDASELDRQSEEPIAGPSRYSCPLCPRSYLQKYHLTRHQQKEHKDLMG